jgi:hypothetical protein
MADDETNIAKVVARSYLNRKEVENSKECGCFYCLAVFSPSDIVLWSDSENRRDEDPGGLRPDSKGFNAFNGNTAICPTCESDSVIGSASGYPISEASLRKLRPCWHRTEFAED